MAFVFTEGFDSYASTADLTKKWGVAGSAIAWGAAAGRTGAGGITIGPSGTGNLRWWYSNTVANYYYHAGFYFKASAAPAAATIFFCFTDGSGNLLSGNEGLRLETSGIMTLFGSNASTSGTTSICDNNWHWIEVYMDGGTANVPGAVYVDNASYAVQSQLQYGGTQSQSGIAFIFVSGITISIDDIVVYDNSTGAPAHVAFPLNSRQITTIRPASDGTVSFATVVGGTGTHSSAVNEVNPDGTTSYVSDSTSGHQDLYNYGALGYTPTNITGVMVNNYLENPNAGTINFQTACKSGATTTLGTSTLTPSTYKTVQTAYNIDPNTSAAWTAAGVNAAQFGIHVP
jgi:hypothetical protein